MDPRSPFDRIRSLLVQLDRPRFRISCREANWLGRNDRQNLSNVVPHSDGITVLRLEPLTEDEVIEILRCRLGVRRPEEFVDRAREAGLGGALDNPQVLGLLARAVKQGGEWPANRRQVFERACQEMAKESNQEHELGNPRKPSTESVLDHAGRLCAMLLISDKAGYSLDVRSQEANYAPRDLCGHDDPSHLQAAVSSHLFQAESERHFSPAHRSLAEFLGARYLAGRLNDGYSARRVIALTTGADGVTPTDLEGLSGWLATQSEIARPELIRNNPIALGIHGDLEAFSAGERQQLLESLLAQPMDLGEAFLEMRRFAPLAVDQTEPLLRTVLNRVDQDPEHEVRVRFVLRILSAADPLPRLAEDIRGIVRDAARSLRVRQAALDVFVRFKKGSPEGRAELMALLEEFAAEGISISNRDLCGALLWALYPGTIGPDQVWDYCTHLGDGTPTGRYFEFWQRGIIALAACPEATEAAVLADLLDALASHISRLKPTIDALRLWKTPLALLRRGLELVGDQVSRERIHAWLGTCSNAGERYVSAPPDSLREIRTWLESRPEIQKHVVLAGLENCADTAMLRHADYRNRKCLLGSKLPSDFGLWCLQQALRLAGTKPSVAEHLLLEAYSAVETPGLDEGLSMEVVREHALQNPRLWEALGQLESQEPMGQLDAQRQQQQRAYAVEQEQQRHQLLETIRSHRDDLLDNRAPPGLLHQLALVYFGQYPDVIIGLCGEDGVLKALRDLDGKDIAMRALRDCIERDDLPSVPEITRMAKTSHEHYLSLPLLAALEERQKSTPGFLNTVRDSSLRTAVACLHCWEPHFLEVANSSPAWYQALLEERREIVSEVAVQCATSAIRGNQPISPRFWGIVEGEEGAPVLGSAALSALRALPTRCNARQIETFDALLWTGVQFGWQSHLLALARERVSRRGLDAGQRIRWLALELICDPDQDPRVLETAASGKEALVRHLAQFCVYGGEALSPEADAWRSVFGDLAPLSLALIVRLLGRYFPPCRPLGFVIVSDELRVSEFLSGVIAVLESTPSRAASESLEELVGDPHLSRWRDVLTSARKAQRVVRRDAEFRHPTLEQACEALQGGRPASASDLAALTVDALDEIGSRIRTGNSNDWRNYWNEGQHGKPSTAKVEGSCRDALLSALRDLLPEGVTAEPEPQFRNGLRADIGIAAEGFKIAVEAKKNCVRDLWAGIHEQLIPKYTLEPASGGYGIYVVFWFGADCQVARPDGERPESPQALEKLLRQSLVEDHYRKIHICVMDVQPPNMPALNQ